MGVACGGADMGVNATRGVVEAAAGMRGALKGAGAAATFGVVGTAVGGGAWPLAGAADPVACPVAAKESGFAWGALSADLEVSCIRLARRSEVLNDDVGWLDIGMLVSSGRELVCSGATRVTAGDSIDSGGGDNLPMGGCSFEGEGRAGVAGAVPFTRSSWLPDEGIRVIT